MLEAEFRFIWGLYVELHSNGYQDDALRSHISDEFVFRFGRTLLPEEYAICISYPCLIYS